MRRWQTKFKRRFLSDADRTVITLWNKKAWPKPEFVGEASLPWTTYRGGDDITSDIVELSSEAHGLGLAVRLAVVAMHSKVEA